MKIVINAPSVVNFYQKFPFHFKWSMSPFSAFNDKAKSIKTNASMMRFFFKIQQNFSCVAFISVLFENWECSVRLNCLRWFPYSFSGTFIPFFVCVNRKLIFNRNRFFWFSFLTTKKSQNWHEIKSVFRFVKKIVFLQISPSQGRKQTH